MGTSTRGFVIGKKVRIPPSVHCGLGIGGRLGFLESGGATGLTSGRLERTTSIPCCWTSLHV